MGQIAVASQTTLLNNANFFVFTLSDASAPDVFLETQAPDKPYGNPIEITFLHNCVAGKTYRIKLWESVDDQPEGVVRNDFSRLMDGSSVKIRTTEYLQVGVTEGLVAGETDYDNTSYEGWTIKVTRNPNVMIPDDTDSTYANYHRKDTGGFNLILTDDKFSADEQFIVEFEPQVTQLDNGVPSSEYGSGRIITADTTLTGDDLNTALILQGSSTILNITFPSLGGVSDFTDKLHFFSNGGIHINAGLITPGTDKIYLKGDKQAVYLGQGEKLSFYKAFSKWWPADTVNDMVGQIVTSAGDHTNTILCAGQLLNRSEYPRLWAWIQTLGAGTVVTDAEWNASTVSHNGSTVFTGKGFFSYGNGSTTFRMPILFGIIKGSSLSNVPGTLELDQVGPHDHEFEIYENGLDGSTGPGEYSFPAITDNNSVRKGKGKATLKAATGGPGQSGKTGDETKVRSILQYFRMRI